MAIGASEKASIASTLIRRAPVMVKADLRKIVPMMVKRTALRMPPGTPTSRNRACDLVSEVSSTLDSQGSSAFVLAEGERILFVVIAVAVPEPTGNRDPKSGPLS
jgi:hypothetical protein